MTPEGKVKEAVKKYLKSEEIFWYMPVSNGMGVMGIPDLLCCIPLTITEDMVGKTLGVFAGIETKAPGKIKNSTPNQKRMLREISEAGGVAIVAQDVALVEAVVKHLKASGLATYYVP
jgi:hypothetical protein